MQYGLFDQNSRRYFKTVFMDFKKSLHEFINKDPNKPKIFLWNKKLTLRSFRDLKGIFIDFPSHEVPTKLKRNSHRTQVHRLIKVKFHPISNPVE